MYRDDGSIIKMQLSAIRWEGGVELLLEGLNRRVNPWGPTREYELHDSLNEVTPEIITDGRWEISDADCTLDAVFVHIGTR